MSFSILEIPNLINFFMMDILYMYQDVPFYFGDSQLTDFSFLGCPFLPWRFPAH